MYIQRETPKPPKTKKPNEPNKPTQQQSNKPYNNQATEKPTSSDFSTNSNNLSPEPTDDQQATTPTPTKRPQLQLKLISPHFQENINWWRGHIKYNNIRTRRYELLLYNCFLILLPKKGWSIMKPMKKVIFCQVRSDTIEWVLETITRTSKRWKRQRQSILALILPEHEQIQ